MDVIRPISKTTTSNNNRTNGGAIATLGTQPLTVGIITSLGEEGIADLDPTERGGAGGLAALDAVLDLGVRRGLVLAPAPAGSVGGGLGDNPAALAVVEDPQTISTSMTGAVAVSRRSYLMTRGALLCYGIYLQEKWAARMAVKVLKAAAAAEYSYGGAPWPVMKGCGAVLWSLWCGGIFDALSLPKSKTVAQTAERSER